MYLSEDIEFKWGFEKQLSENTEKKTHFMTFFKLSAISLCTTYIFIFNGNNYF